MDDACTPMAIRFFTNALQSRTEDSTEELTLLRECQDVCVQVLLLCGRHYTTQPLDVLARVTKGVLIGEMVLDREALDHLPVSYIPRSFAVLGEDVAFFSKVKRVRNWLQNVEDSVRTRHITVLTEAVRDARITLSNVLMACSEDIPCNSKKRKTN